MAENHKPDHPIEHGLEDGTGNNRSKQPHRVKFSIGPDEDDDAGAASSSDVRASIQRIIAPPPPTHLPDEAVTFKPPDWSGRTNAAAIHAQDKASRLASRLSHSAPGSRRSSVEDFRTLPKSTYKRPQPIETIEETKAIVNPDTPRPGQTFLSNANKLSDLTHSKFFSTLQSKSKSNSPTVYPIAPPTSPPRQAQQYPVKFDDIPLMDMSNQGKDRRPYSLYEESTDDDSDGPQKEEPPQKNANDPSAEAHRLVRAMTRKFGSSMSRDPDRRSGTETPAIDKRLHDVQYVPVPLEYKPGILSSLLRLYDQNGAGAAIQRQSDPGRQHGSTSSTSFEPRKKPPTDIHDHERNKSVSSTGSSRPSTGPSSGKGTPHRTPKWYDKSPGGSPGDSRSQSTSSLVHLLQTSVASAAPGLPIAAGDPSRSSRGGRSSIPRSRSSGMIAAAVEAITHPHEALRSLGRHRPEDQIAITDHIAAVIARQRYLIRLCRALMIYGAPTHRLEEYMKTSARVLQIEGQFLYLPGCMIVSFDDPDTHTAEVQLVKAIQGVDLGKFKDTFIVYKNVLHDLWGVEEATTQLDEIMTRPSKFPIWTRVLIYGLASLAVGPFAFGARPIDFPISFLLGCILGVLQLVVAPKSEQFQHVFEVAASVITSFLARAFGSITYKGEYLFCFSALAQSSIALILPGYIILCASLELQSRNIVAGSVRMVYAIIYSLFLGFGITIGTALFGLMKSDAVTDVTCKVPPYWTNEALIKFPFVPIFTLCLIIINQAKWKQAPVMIGIAFAGYITNFGAGKRLANNVQVANALGAFVVGALANLYSRFFHGLAAAAMLPAIFVQVPSGLAATGSLVAGLSSAEQITKNATGVTVIDTAQGFQNATGASYAYSGTIFNVGYGMVQVAIGISVGLFLSALVVYPLGKRRSGLFSF